MDELVDGAMRSMQAGLAPLKQPVPASGPERGSVDRAVGSDLNAAAEAIKREVGPRPARPSSYESRLGRNTVTACSGAALL